VAAPPDVPRFIVLSQLTTAFGAMLLHPLVPESGAPDWGLLAAINSCCATPCGAA